MKRALLLAFPVGALALFFGCERQVEEQQYGGAQTEMGRQQQDDVAVVPVPVPVPVPVEEGAQEQPAQQAQQSQEGQQQAAGGAGPAGQIEQPIVGRFLGTEEGMLIVQDNWKRTHALHIGAADQKKLENLEPGDTVHVFHEDAEKGRKVTKLEVPSRQEDKATGGAGQER